MSDVDICSDDEKYGEFGAAMANSVAADSAAPARAVAAMAAVRAPGTKKSLPVLSLLLSASEKPRTAPSARRSLTCLRTFCRLQHPRLFLMLPSTRLQRAHLWR